MNLYFISYKLDYNSLEMAIQILEIIFLLDIFLKMFIIKDEDCEKYDKPINSFKITSRSYFQSDFWFDLIVWIPWGELGKHIVHKDLNVLDMIKVARLTILLEYINDKNIKRVCSNLFDRRFKQILEDPILSQDFKHNRTMIEARILVNNVAISLKILVNTVIILYFTASVWLISSLIFFHWEDQDSGEEHFVSPLLNLPLVQKVLQCFYFALTTLSTVGFGDFYPKSDLERIVGAQVILFGVALFSIIISEFLDMINKI